MNAGWLARSAHRWMRSGTASLWGRPGGTRRGPTMVTGPACPTGGHGGARRATASRCGTRVACGLVAACGKAGLCGTLADRLLARAPWRSVTRHGDRCGPPASAGPCAESLCTLPTAAAICLPPRRHGGRPVARAGTTAWATDVPSGPGEGRRSSHQKLPASCRYPSGKATGRCTSRLCGTGGGAVPAPRFLVWILPCRRVIAC